MVIIIALSFFISFTFGWWNQVLKRPNKLQFAPFFPLIEHVRFISENGKENYSPAIRVQIKVCMKWLVSNKYLATRSSLAGQIQKIIFGLTNDISDDFAVL